MIPHNITFFSLVTFSLQQKNNIQYNTDKKMFGVYSQINENQALKDKNIKHNSSSNMHKVLYGYPDQPEINKTHFIDSKDRFISALERFKKDFAVFHREERQVMKEKKCDYYRNRYEKISEANQKCYQNNEYHDMKQTTKVMNYQSLYDLGIKKTGTTTGIPVNPINHQYYDLTCAKNYQHLQNQKKMNHILRQHHLQKNNSSGYNLINGKQNCRVEQVVPESFKAGMDSRIHQYNQHYSLRPPYFS